MTRIGINHIRRAEVLLGDSETTVYVDGTIDGDGELAQLDLVQVHGDQILGRIAICELEYSEEVMAAIRAVWNPPTPTNADDAGDDDSLDAVERAEALREEAMILSSAAGHLKQARRHQDAVLTLEQRTSSAGLWGNWNFILRGVGFFEFRLWRRRFRRFRLGRISRVRVPRAGNTSELRLDQVFPDAPDRIAFGARQYEPRCLARLSHVDECGKDGDA